MKRDHLLMAGAMFAAASIAYGSALAQSGKRETIRPDISNKESTTGGTQSQRTQSGTPLPEGSPFSGTVEMGHPNLRQDVKAAQQALKEQGFDPGPVDGMIGPRTREALKSFQTSNGLETTGTLNPATAKKLGVEPGPSKGSDDMNNRKNSSGK
jgi:murein L,D-transpeptidase YcbB/YkuD